MAGVRDADEEAVGPDEEPRAGERGCRGRGGEAVAETDGVGFEDGEGGDGEAWVKGESGGPHSFGLCWVDVGVLSFRVWAVGVFESIFFGASKQTLGGVPVWEESAWRGTCFCSGGFDVHGVFLWSSQTAEQ